MRRDSESSKCTSRRSASRSAHNNQFISRSGWQMLAHRVVPTRIERFVRNPFGLLPCICLQRGHGEQRGDKPSVGQLKTYIQPPSLARTLIYHFVHLRISIVPCNSNMFFGSAHRIKLVGFLDIITYVVVCSSPCRKSVCFGFPAPLNYHSMSHRATLNSCSKPIRDEWEVMLVLEKKISYLAPSEKSCSSVRICFPYFFFIIFCGF